MFSACGGGGGGGPEAQTLAQLTCEIGLPSSLAGTGGGPVAIVILEVRSDGALHWSAAVPPAVVPDITGLTLNRASDASVLADLLGAGTFDTVTGAASGTAAVTPADAADLAANPADYLATLLTSTNPPASGGIVIFAPAEWHAVLLGGNESPVVDADARGAATFRVASPTTIEFVIAMSDPVQADVTLAHIHVGEPGENGLIVLDLNVAGAARDAAAGTISGTVAVDGQTLARIAADLTGHYCNVHTAAAPNGVARGQLDEGVVEMTAALLGSAEAPVVVDGNARGGATLEFDTFTSGRVITALYSATEDIDDVILQHIHIGAAGVPGTILIDLMGADYTTNPASDSAEATITYTQAAFTRILANPNGFYVNLHTTAAAGGLVRGQLSTAERTIFAPLTGGEVTPTPGTGSAIARVVFTGVHSCAYTITTQTPAAADITEAHLHDGAAGENGIQLVDFFESGDRAVSGNTISGTAAVPGRTLARILGGTPGGSTLAGGELPSVFYIDLHTEAEPGGAARGQITQISGDTPPAGLSYTTPVVYETASPITQNSPSSIGGAIDSYVIAPALSSGLSIHPTSGAIFGTPTATRAATDYTVTATNSAGSTQAIVNITVNVGPPKSLKYTSPVSYIQGTQIQNNNPVATGGAIATFSVSPDLPAGLSLHPTTGVISGTPTAVTTAANYTVTGTNAAGSVEAIVNITVTSSVTAPSNLVYATPVNYPTGYAITNNTPTVSGSTPMTFIVAPSLPAGLSLDGSTGVISGTPTTITAAANYVVTATNAAGNTQATVNIAVSLGKPGPFTYSNNPNLGYANPPFAIQTMTPTHTGGGATSTYTYSVSPALPAGITISSTTGVISGTPTATTTPGNETFTVTASNSAGTTTTQVTISVPY